MSVAAGPSLEVLPSLEAVAIRGATLLAEALLDPQRPPSGLATGRTMLPLYGALRPLLLADRRFEPSAWRSFLAGTRVLPSSTNLLKNPKPPT